MLNLLDYRRQVADLYAVVRQNTDAYPQWKSTRDKLLKEHPQSALSDEQKQHFSGLPYYDYNPDYRILVELNTQVEQKIFEGDIGDDGLLRYKRIGTVTFTLPTGTGTVSVFWIMGYGGGLFLPFKDATNGNTTYGAGRYLYDTIKGADLGTSDGKMILDFNYAYHPSCAYHHRWICPLAPAENKVDFPILTGEILKKTS